VFGSFARHHDRRTVFEGTLIRHASETEPFPVELLPVPMIEPAFQTLLVTAIGFAALLSSCFLAAVLTAVALPTVTGSTDIKRGPAPADSLAENDFGGHPVAFELDNGWPLMSGWKRYILVWRFTAATAQTPAVPADGVSLIGNVLPYIVSSTPPPCGG